MAGKNRLNNFNNLSLSEKMGLFDICDIEKWLKFESKELQIFLKDIILNQEEIPYIRKQALDTFINLVLLDKIKKRNALNLLLDNWFDEEEIFLELYRLKCLFLFYEDEPEEIEGIYKNHLENEICEIKSESLFQLGSIYLFKANEHLKEKNYLSLLNESLRFFRECESLEENQINANFFCLVIEILIGISAKQYLVLEERIEELAKLLWDREIFLYQETTSVYIGIYRVLNSLKKINSKSLNDSLDLRKEFNELSCYFYKIKNQEFKSILLKGVTKNVIIRTIEPIFIIKLSAEKCRIEKRINELDESSKELEFLQYILNLLNEPNQLELAQKDFFYSKIRQAFPNIEEKRIENILEEKRDLLISNPTLVLMDVLDHFLSYSYENLLDNVIKSCIEMQGSKIMWNVTENERNTYLRSLLTAAKFIVNDQTLWSQSYAGKTAGEIDLFVKEKDGKPFSIIEALNLKSLDKNYLKLHLEKVFTYDTTGLKCNFILIYYEGNNLSGFWEKYQSYISNFDFPYEKIAYEDVPGFDYTDMRISKTVHLRNEKSINLYHLVFSIKG